METYAIELKRYHDQFVANLMLLLQLNITKTHSDNYTSYVTKCDLPTNIVLFINNFDIPKKDTSVDDSQYKQLIVESTQKKVSDNLEKLKTSSNNFLSSIMNGELSIDGVSGIIKKIFNAISSNYQMLSDKNPRLFQLKSTKDDGRQVTITLIPGIDMVYSWYTLDTQSRENLWFYLENMFISGTKMIHLVNETSVSNFDTKILKELNYAKLKKDFSEAFPEQQVINVINLDIDPFLGIGVDNQELGLENFVQTNNTQQVQQPGLGSMAKMLGVDKMINMEELSKQLKNISKTEIEDATSNIKKLLGSNVDEGTSEMIGTILSDITEQLKESDLSNGDPITNIISIAEKVAKNAIPKIDPNKVDMKKVFESTQNLANSYKDKDGKPIMGGDNNPIAMLTQLMKGQMNMKGGPNSKQMKMAEDMMRNLMSKK